LSDASDAWEPLPEADLNTEQLTIPASAELTAWANDRLVVWSDAGLKDRRWRSIRTSRPGSPRHPRPSQAAKPAPSRSSSTPTPSWPSAGVATTRSTTPNPTGGMPSTSPLGIMPATPCGRDMRFWPGETRAATARAANRSSSKRGASRLPRSRIQGDLTMRSRCRGRPRRTLSSVGRRSDAQTSFRFCQPPLVAPFLLRVVHWSGDSASRL
jgi:hypothetical protein